MRPKVAIAGCAGFLGKRLAKKLSRDYDVIGLGRSARPPEELQGVVAEWRQVDLFSLAQAQAALAGCDYCYYLVHSMLPKDALAQGQFEDFDYLAADNFARAAKKNGLKQIIYMGGLIPAAALRLSRHLASRREVEDVLGATGVPLTTLRAGLIVGAEGSSFLILLRLVRRLPAMICPKWTQSLTQPIDIEDALSLLIYCLANKATLGRTFDIGGSDVLSYRDMIAVTARALGKRRFLFSVPLFTPSLSRLWVTLTTGIPRALVYPLVESLKYEMTATSDELVKMAGIKPKSFEQSVKTAIAETQNGLPTPLLKKSVAPHQVRSIQRFGCPAEWTAQELALLYFAWAPVRFRPFLRCESNQRVCVFHSRFPQMELLKLELSQTESSDDVAVLNIVGGKLTRGPKGRLEFRRLARTRQAIAAVHDFEPRLAWWIYKLTQAPLHVWVMRSFGNYVQKTAGHQS